MDILSPLLPAPPFRLEVPAPAVPGGSWVEKARPTTWVEKSRPTTWVEKSRPTAWRKSMPVNPTPVEKRTQEVKTYTMYFSDQAEISAGDTINAVVSVVAATLTTGATDLTVGTTGVLSNGRGITMVLSGGSSVARYRVTVVVTTTGGATLKGVGYMVVDDS